MLQKILPKFLELSNQKWLSNLLKNISTSKISKYLIPLYVNVYGISFDETKKGLTEFQTLHELFTRELKDGQRNFDETESVVISPVDCVVEDLGMINEQSNFVVKEQNYSIVDMLGTQKTAEKYIGGTYMILYLSPSHYHRIHTPIDGEVILRKVLGDKSYPVNKLGLKYGKSPLSKNFRIVTEMVHQSKHIAFVKVGAMFVNSIEITNSNSFIQKGDEVGYFSFGSTVILLFEKNSFTIQNDIIRGKGLKMGESIGRML